MTNSVTAMERGERGGKGWSVPWGATAAFENGRWPCQILSQHHRRKVPFFLLGARTWLYDKIPNLKHFSVGCSAPITFFRWVLEPQSTRELYAYGVNQPATNLHRHRYKLTCHDVTACDKRWKSRIRDNDARWLNVDWLIRKHSRYPL